MVKGRRKFLGKRKTTHTTSKVNRELNTRNLKTTIPQKNETYSMSNYDGVNEGFGSGSSSIGGLPDIPNINAELDITQDSTQTGDITKDGKTYKNADDVIQTPNTETNNQNQQPRPTPPYEDITNEKGNMIHTVNFKNLYGDNKSKSINIKLKKGSSIAKNAPLMNMLAAMELQKDAKFQEKSAAMNWAQVPENLGTKETGDTIMDAAYTVNYVHGAHLKGQVDEFGRSVKSNAQKHHGNVFDHITDGFGGHYQTPNQKARPNSTDPKTSSLYNQRPKDWEPKKYGDRGLPGIGRISATGFAGGKRGDDPFKFTQPKNRGFKVTGGVSKTPQWAKFKVDAIKTKAQYNDQFTRNKGSKGVNIVNGRRVVGGSQKIRDSMDLFGGQELPTHERINLGDVPNFANPDYIAANEAGKKRSAAAAKKHELSLLDQYSEENLSGSKF